MYMDDKKTRYPYCGTFVCGTSLSGGAVEPGGGGGSSEHPGGLSSGLN